MESQPQNPEFRNNPENFHPCAHPELYKQGSHRNSKTQFHDFSMINNVVSVTI